MASVDLPTEIYAVGRSSDMARDARNPFEKASRRVLCVSASLIGTFVRLFQGETFPTSLPAPEFALNMACLVPSLVEVTLLTIRLCIHPPSEELVTIRVSS